MPVKLNLIPPELSAKGAVGKTTSLTRNLSVILLVIFLIFVLGASAFFIVSSLESRRLATEIAGLKGEIRSLETTEQRMVLLKDRLGKIKLSSNFASSQDGLEKINEVIALIPAEVRISELSTDSDRVDLSLAFSSSATLSTFLSQLALVESFDTISLTSFGFNPATGYVVGIRFTSS